MKEIVEWLKRLLGHSFLMKTALTATFLLVINFSLPLSFFAEAFAGPKTDIRASIGGPSLPKVRNWWEAIEANIVTARLLCVTFELGLFIRVYSVAWKERANQIRRFGSKN